MCGSNVRWKTVPESTASSGESMMYKANYLHYVWALLPVQPPILPLLAMPLAVLIHENFVTVLAKQ